VSSVAERTTPYAVSPFPLPSLDEPVSFLPGFGLIALRAIRRAEARLLRAEADALAALHTARADSAWGFVSFTDFAREILTLAPRTTQRRLALHHTLAASPALSLAFDRAEISLCQALALRPLALDPALPFWIERAASLTVRQLSLEVRSHLRSARDSVSPVGGGPSETAANRSVGVADSNALESTDPPDDSPGRTITFSAPVSAALAWEHSLDLARRVLGWEAPPHLCVEAVLAEALPALDPSDLPQSVARASAPPDSTPAATTPDNAAFATTLADAALTSTALSDTAPADTAPPPFLPSSRDVRRLRDTLALVHREFLHVHGLAVPPHGTMRDPTEADPSPSTPEATHHQGEENAVQRFLDLLAAHRPLRLLQGRLLQDLHSSGAIRALGSPSLRHFAEHHLHLSERSARSLVSESFLFDDQPALARAYATGSIGLGQAIMVHRLALPSTLDAFIQRAASTTHLHFAREARFLLRFRDLLPHIARRFRGPLPLNDLEPTLIQCLLQHGVSPQSIASEIRDRRLHTRGIEHLLQEPASKLVDASAASPGSPVNDPPSDALDPAAEPTLLRRLETLLELLALRLSDDPSIASAHPVLHPEFPEDRQMLAPLARLTTISFWLPDSLLSSWTTALDLVRARWGPLPTWAAATLLLEAATREWLRLDPERIPTETRILERDDYRCRVPGCSKRSQLEVHHIVFRSHDGSDHPDNLVTTCAVHHRQRLHGTGSLRVRGEAPHRLVWELGPKNSPWRILHGERIVSRGRGERPA
jgi:hypothetical protein